jgi:L-aspartate oxidase
MIPRYLINFSSENLPQSFSTVLVIGSGIAGLSVALRTAEFCDVTLLTKSELGETATRYAQGGIAAALGEEDSPRLHLRDTLEAGKGLCDEDAVEVLVNEGPECLNELMELGARFDFSGGRLSLSLEGGHSVARVAHAGGDATGREVELALVAAVEGNARLARVENVFAVDLLSDEKRCLGVLAFDIEEQKFRMFYARAVVLAAGGMGQIFKITTNPAICTGDGIAMALRAGAELADVEFVQFHPTAFYAGSNPRFLITEALRGEGAYLKDHKGRRFMLGAHPLAELAPRDVVVREMVKVMKASGKDYLFIDATHLPAENLRKNFPTVFTKCLENGIDISKDWIPVAPAAHYMSGGVRTDLNGRTSLRGLYACGEVACTGIHGANRLASNSLLEGLVFSRRISRILPGDLEESPSTSSSLLQFNHQRKNRNHDAGALRAELQEMMISQVGVVRNEAGLRAALKFLKDKEEIQEYELGGPAGFELQNMLEVASMVAMSALERGESRGVHFREDYPASSEEFRKHIVLRKEDSELSFDFRELKSPRYA